MKNILLLWLCTTIGIQVFSQEQSVTVQTPSKVNTIELKFDLPTYTVKDTVLPSEYGVSQNFSYIEVSDDEYGIVDSIGYPLLPQLSFYVNVPHNATNFTVTLQDTEYQSIIIEQFVLPAQEDIRKDSSVFNFSMDTAFYTSTNSFVGLNACILEEFWAFGEKGVTLSILPFTYNPSTGNVVVLKSALVSISYSLDSLDSGERNDSLCNPVVEDYLEHLFINYEASRSTRYWPLNYLIITDPEFESTVSYFANYKRNLGYDVSVVTTNTTTTNPLYIRLYLIALYNSLITRPTYVLLVGDADKIPVSWGNNSDIEHPITDIDYSLLEGNDWIPDVFLGRWPVSDVQELKNIINKTIFMEMNLSNTSKKAVFIAGKESRILMQNSFEAGHNYVVKKTFQPIGYQCAKLYQPSDSIVGQSLSNNPRYFIYSGHGKKRYWDGYSFSLYYHTLDIATNTVFPFAFAFACRTGDFSDTANIGKFWIIKSYKGGVAYFGSSVPSLTNTDNVLEKKIFGNSYSDDYAITSIINEGKNKYRIFYWGGNVFFVKRYLRAYNLLGDPSIYPRGIGCLNNVYFYNNEYFHDGAFTEYRVSYKIKNFNIFHVDSAACVRLQAGEEIVLNNGFYAEEGADFTAIIAPCGSRDVNQLEFIPENNTETLQNQNIESVKLFQDNHSDIESNGMLIFPNPTNLSFTISFTETQESIKQMCIFDMQGKIMLRQENLLGNTINISNLPSGTYIVQVISKRGKEYACKLVKE
ncbi:MAG: T9SS type A sorting domain-containing protein [Bacteroidales bacterium]|nr:T9SS type A sorting domain-containing protein [Bacteroidales bacterium]